MIKRIFKKIDIGLSLAWRLSPNLLRGIQLFGIYMMFPLAKRLGFSEKPHQLRISYKGQTVDVSVFSSTDFAVMKEVFIDKEYELKDSFMPEVIFDIGSNTGFSVIYWKLVYPQSRVYAFEPDLVTFSKLECNIKPFKDVVAINSAIANSSGQTDFYVHPESSISSSLKERDPRAIKVSVNAMTLNEAIEQTGEAVDLVKFDVEGAEFSIFESRGHLGVRRLIGEYHEDLAGRPLSEFLALFPYYQPEVIKVSDGRYIVYLKYTHNE